LTDEKKELRELLAKRKKEKRKKPKFQRQESWRYKRLRESWRRPRGLDSKMRKKVKGWPSSPNSGYRGPRKGRGLHPSAFREVMVFNLDDLNGVNPKVEAIRISHSVGERKRIEIVNKAKEMGIYILNPRGRKELVEAVAEKKDS
jgi:large subunit ribosomal protein L32e